MGIVLNRPHKISLKDVLIDMNVNQVNSNTRIPIFNGGPVSLEKGFLLHNSDIEFEESIEINEDGQEELNIETKDLHIQEHNNTIGQ